MFNTSYQCGATKSVVDGITQQEAERYSIPDWSRFAAPARWNKMTNDEKEKFVRTVRDFECAPSEVDESLYEYYSRSSSEEEEVPPTPVPSPRSAADENARAWISHWRVPEGARRMYKWTMIAACLAVLTSTWKLVSMVGPLDAMVICVLAAVTYAALRYMANKKVFRAFKFVNGEQVWLEFPEEGAWVIGDSAQGRGVVSKANCQRLGKVLLWAFLAGVWLVGAIMWLFGFGVIATASVAAFGTVAHGFALMWSPQRWWPKKKVNTIYGPGYELPENWVWLGRFCFQLAIAWKLRKKPIWLGMHVGSMALEYGIGNFLFKHVTAALGQLIRVLDKKPTKATDESVFMAAMMDEREEDEGKAYGADSVDLTSPSVMMGIFTAVMILLVGVFGLTGRAKGFVPRFTDGFHQTATMIRDVKTFKDNAWEVFIGLLNSLWLSLTGEPFMKINDMKAWSTELQALGEEIVPLRDNLTVISGKVTGARLEELEKKLDKLVADPPKNSSIQNAYAMELRRVLVRARAQLPETTVTDARAGAVGIYFYAHASAGKTYNSQILARQVGDWLNERFVDAKSVQKTYMFPQGSNFHDGYINANVGMYPDFMQVIDKDIQLLLGLLYDLLDGVPKSPLESQQEAKGRKQFNLKVIVFCSNHTPENLKTKVLQPHVANVDGFTSRIDFCVEFRGYPADGDVRGCSLLLRNWNGGHGVQITMQQLFGLVLAKVAVNEAKKRQMEKQAKFEPEWPVGSFTDKMLTSGFLSRNIVTIGEAQKAVYEVFGISPLEGPGSVALDAPILGAGSEADKDKDLAMKREEFLQKYGEQGHMTMIELQDVTRKKVEEKEAKETRPETGEAKGLVNVSKPYVLAAMGRAWWGRLRGAADDDAEADLYLTTGGWLGHVEAGSEVLRTKLVAFDQGKFNELVRTFALNFPWAGPIEVNKMAREAIAIGLKPNEVPMLPGNPEGISKVMASMEVRNQERRQRKMQMLAFALTTLAAGGITVYLLRRFLKSMLEDGVAFSKVYTHEVSTGGRKAVHTMSEVQKKVVPVKSATGKGLANEFNVSSSVMEYDKNGRDLATSIAVRNGRWLRLICGGKVYESGGVAIAAEVIRTVCHGFPDELQVGDRLVIYSANSQPLEMELEEKKNPFRIENFVTQQGELDIKDFTIVDPRYHAARGLEKFLQSPEDRHTIFEGQVAIPMFQREGDRLVHDVWICTSQRITPSVFTARSAVRTVRSVDTVIVAYPPGKSEADLKDGICGSPCIVLTTKTKRKLAGQVIAGNERGVVIQLYPCVEELGDGKSLVLEGADTNYHAPGGEQLPLPQGMVCVGRVPAGEEYNSHCQPQIHPTTLNPWKCKVHKRPVECFNADCDEKSTCPYSKCVANLQPFYSKGEKHYPHYDNLKRVPVTRMKDEEQIKTTREELEEVASTFYGAAYPPPAVGLRPVLTWDESLNGVRDGDKVIYAGVNLDTSIGPLSAEQKKKCSHPSLPGKWKVVSCPKHKNPYVCHKYHGCTERLVMDAWFLEECERTEAELMQGPIEVVSMRALKANETKTYPSPARGISIFPFAYLMTKRRWLGPLTSGTKAQGPLTVSGVGIDLLGVQGTLLYNKFKAVGKRALYFDISKADSTMAPECKIGDELMRVQAMKTWTRGVYTHEEVEKHERMIRHIARSTMLALEQIDAHVYEEEGRIMSGDEGTSHHGTGSYVTAHLLVLKTWLESQGMKLTLETFHSKFALFAYSDDCLVGKEDSSKLTSKIYGRIWERRFGQKLVDPEDKTKDYTQMKDDYALTDIRLLGRKPRVEFGQVYWGLKESTVEMITMWGKDNQPETILALMDNQIREIFYNRDRDLFNTRVARATVYAHEHLIAWTAPTWEELEKNARSEHPGSKILGPAEVVPGAGEAYGLVDDETFDTREEVGVAKSKVEIQVVKPKEEKERPKEKKKEKSVPKPRPEAAMKMESVAHPAPVADTGVLSTIVNGFNQFVGTLGGTASNLVQSLAPHLKEVTGLVKMAAALDKPQIEKAAIFVTQQSWENYTRGLSPARSTRSSQIKRTEGRMLSYDFEANCRLPQLFATTFVVGNTAAGKLNTYYMSLPFLVNRTRTVGTPNTYVIDQNAIYHASRMFKNWDATHMFLAVEVVTSKDDTAELGVFVWPPGASALIPAGVPDVTQIPNATFQVVGSQTVVLKIPLVKPGMMFEMGSAAGTTPSIGNSSKSFGGFFSLHLMSAFQQVATTVNNTLYIRLWCWFGDEFRLMNFQGPSLQNTTVLEVGAKKAYLEMSLTEEERLKLAKLKQVYDSGGSGRAYSRVVDVSFLEPMVTDEEKNTLMKMGVKFDCSPDEGRGRAAVTAEEPAAPVIAVESATASERGGQQEEELVMTTDWSDVMMKQAVIPYPVGEDTSRRVCIGTGTWDGSAAGSVLQSLNWPDCLFSASPFLGNILYGYSRVGVTAKVTIVLPKPSTYTGQLKVMALPGVLPADTTRQQSVYQFSQHPGITVNADQPVKSSILFGWAVPMPTLHSTLLTSGYGGKLLVGVTVPLQGGHPSQPASMPYRLYATIEKVWVAGADANTVPAQAPKAAQIAQGDLERMAVFDCSPADGKGYSASNILEVEKRVTTRQVDGIQAPVEETDLSSLLKRRVYNGLLSAALDIQPTPRLYSDWQVMTQPFLFYRGDMEVMISQVTSTNTVYGIWTSPSAAGTSDSSAQRSLMGYQKMYAQEVANTAWNYEWNDTSYYMRDFAGSFADGNPLTMHIVATSYSQAEVYVSCGDNISFDVPTALLQHTFTSTSIDVGMILSWCSEGERREIARAYARQDKEKMTTVLEGVVRRKLKE